MCCVYSLEAPHKFSCRNKKTIIWSYAQTICLRKNQISSLSIDEVFHCSNDSVSGVVLIKPGALMRTALSAYAWKTHFSLYGAHLFSLKHILMNN